MGLFKRIAEAIGNARRKGKRKKGPGLGPAGNVRVCVTESSVVWKKVPARYWERAEWLVWPRGIYEDLSQQQVEDAMARFVNQAKKRQLKYDCDRQARDEELSRMYPAIEEFLTLRMGEDGKVRQTASVTLFAENGVFTICLNDRAEGYSTFASGQTVLEAVEALEAALESGEADWRRPKGKR